MSGVRNIALGLLCCIGGGVIGWSSYLYFKKFASPKRRNKNKVVRERWSEPVNEVLFFPDTNFACRNYFSSTLGCEYGSKCKYEHTETSLSKLCFYLESAQTSLDVCLYILSNRDLSDSMVIAQKNGAKVRLLIDSTMAQSEPYRLKELVNKGVTVQPAQTRFMLHHKFAVVDCKLVITGSFNWTAQATLGNYDNAVISSNMALVTPYIAEFQRLWNLFSLPQDSDNDGELQKRLEKYPFLRSAAWDDIIVGHKTPDVKY